MPASAATLVSTGGAFAAPAAPTGSVTIDFNSAVAAPFTATYVNAELATGSLGGFFGEPAFSDGSRYATVFGNGSIILQSALAFNSISFYAGSIDPGNAIDLLDASGTIFASFGSADFLAQAFGDTGEAVNNRSVTISIGENDPQIAGVRFTSQTNSFELDNVVFAVPEVSTWALMLVGFGMIGTTTRYRRRKSTVAFS